MKKILTLAALMAIVAMPVTGASAAAAAKPMASPKVDAICYFLPLLPNCITEWKAAHPMAPMAKPVAAATKVAVTTTKTVAKATTATMNMMMMPKCTPAPAGSAYLYVCK